MENLGKENFMALHNNPFETFETKRLSKLIPESQSNKPKTKSTKVTASSIREGDWICLICNNFNFSFRDECNRCQVQTKMLNLIQGLQLASEKQPSNPTERLPLRDLTNQKQPPNSLISHNFDLSRLSVQNNGNKERNTANRQLSDLFDENKDNFDFFSNYGFGNALLLTPPRALKKTETYEDLPGSYEKELPVYKSPKQLPSVSPILKKLILNGFEKNGKNSNLSSSKVKLSFPDQLPMNQEENLQSSLDSGVDKKELYEGKLKDDEFDLSLSHLLTEDEGNNSVKLLKELEKHIQMPLNYPQTWNNNLIEEEWQNKNKKGKHDWICPKCRNLNYSFRKFCNRCQFLK